MEGRPSSSDYRADLAVVRDLGVISFMARIGDLLAIRRVGRGLVVRIVVGDLEGCPPGGLDCVDLVVVPVEGRLSYLGAGGRVVWSAIVYIVVGDVKGHPPVGSIA